MFGVLKTLFNILISNFIWPWLFSSVENYLIFTEHKSSFSPPLGFNCLCVHIAIVFLALSHHAVIIIVIYFMSIMCQSCTKILHILLLMFRTISWGHHYYPYFWDEETDRNMVPKVTQGVSYKTRINSRSSGSNSHIISTTSRCTGCGLFFFSYLSLYVYCLK